ncbi:YheC/YheD family protein [Bacillus sp. FJAT-47783]|uniref:YheC/YheD family endospore coat-associated protein n=1 Tax=Bacillus sp. FJAT-47783 TaxID=2922712 RepID=UPI001FAC84BA|nr:YheC/YheD family protein [Bacillus sp. FJAT-47783]
MTQNHFLVAILTGESTPPSPFKGNVHLFKHLQEKALQYGGFTYVFTSQNVQDHHIVGYYYNVLQKRWVQKKFPYPDVVYNRYPFRENESSLLSLFERFDELHIPIFNRYFFNKWDVYTCLMKNKSVKRYLPNTKLVHHVQDITSFLQSYRSIYLKPVQSSQGNGIIKVAAKGEGQYVIQTVQHKTIVFSIEQLLHTILQFMTHSPYIMQEEIMTDTLYGKKYDLRLFVHLHEKMYSPSGIGVRVADRQTVTTHVPTGGKIVSFNEVHARIDPNQLGDICHEIGQTLCDQYGLIGEFSLDMGRRKDGQLFVFEVNSKPMKFDEPLIFQQGIHRLIQLFQQLSNQGARNVLHDG